MRKMANVLEVSESRIALFDVEQPSLILRNSRHRHIDPCEDHAEYTLYPRRIPACLCSAQLFTSDGMARILASYRSTMTCLCMRTLRANGLTVGELLPWRSRRTEEYTWHRTELEINAVRLRKLSRAKTLGGEVPLLARLGSQPGRRTCPISSPCLSSTTALSTPVKA
ncbi:hypothetical protein NEOLEDRAFT_751581 [Neolentinus lepideus HHB14362 ss-1]|uniref:Uncharacterized protein n=1 Tax=Neolentinus lepideus HHB14362 ss-1 TaxID=1314782 RepID=A0A165PUF5_9AGAM|nr:hypothetical protein NEOLEDRAFT_751581 [Neolentinus lepideus HHB14362 ss-1]